MMSKKAQQEIIVTVLLVLIALAAVAAVATFVINNVKKSTAGADDKQACLRVELNVASINTTQITLQRTGVADPALTNITIYGNGVVIGGTNGDITPGASSTVKFYSAQVSKAEITAAPTLTDGYTCPVMAKSTLA